jgi:hemolysin activation/secretion protein
MKKTTLLLFLFSNSYIYAENNAGSIANEIDKQFNAPTLKQPPKTIRKEKESITQENPAALKIVVKGFELSGNTLIDSNEIQNILSNYIGKRLSFNQIQNATRDIAELYRVKWYAARAFLPPQEVQNGIIQIIILEGTLSAIEIDAQAVERISATYAQNIIKNAHPIGEKIQTQKLQKGLLLLSDTPGIISKSTLVSGEKAGESKVKVKLKDTNLMNGFLSYSNTGSKSTGSHQVALAVSLNSPLGIGDQINTQMMKTKGIEYGKVSYTLPLGYSGLRVGVYGNAMNYDVIEETDADGSTSSLGVTSSYPIIRSRDLNLNFGLNYDHKSYKNYTSDIKVSDKTNKVLSTVLNGSYFDKYGMSQFSTQISFGKIDLSGEASDLLADSTTTKTQGNYQKLFLSAQRYQNINETLFFTLLGTLQLANKNLDSSEKLSLGGAYGVRAYPSNEATGDEGWLINAEITKRLQYGFGVSAFYDIGQIKQNKNLYTNWQGLSIAKNSYLIKGVGVSTSYTKGALSTKATLTWKVGNNPNPQANGSDNDGTNKDPRFWVQLNYSF